MSTRLTGAQEAESKAPVGSANSTNWSTGSRVGAHVVFCGILEIVNATANPQQKHHFSGDSENPLANPKFVRKCQYEQKFKRECNRKMHAIFQISGFSSNSALSFSVAFLK